MRQRRRGNRWLAGYLNGDKNKLSICGRRSCYLRPRVALPSAASSTNGGREETTSQRGRENDVELPHKFSGTKKGAISLVREIAPIVSFLLCKKA